MNIKLYDSELKIMDVLWKEGSLTAGQLAKILKQEIGWNRNTTYTVIKKCISKGSIIRSEPNFMCTAAISREEVQHNETAELINKYFDGSPEKLFSAFLYTENISQEEINKLKQLINNLK